MATRGFGFLLFQLTKSAFALGMLGLCEAIPAVGIALYGGYIADKSEKRKMLLWIYSAVLVSSIVMAFVTSNGVSAYVHKNWIVPVIYVMIFFNGLARAFYGPATFTVYAHSIPKEVYPNGSTWSSSSWQIASILGPAAGGLIYGFGNKLIPGTAGITVTFMVIVALLIVSLVIVYRLKTYPPVYKPKEKIWDSLAEGIHFV